MIKALIRTLTARTGKARAAGSVAAVYLQADGTVQLLQLDVVSQQVLQWHSQTAANGQQTEVVLQLLDAIPAATPLCLVLASEFYQLVQLDKPALAANEVMQALPWLVKELSDIPAEDLLLDYLDVPAQPNQQQSRIQLVLTARSRWLPLCQALQRRRINLLNMQPEEWLARNLLGTGAKPAADQSGAVMLLSHLPGQELSLQIVKQGMVFFSRKLRGFNRLDQYDFAELQQGMLDNLLLEVQRSLDYFEGQLRQPPVKEILFILASTTLPAIVQYFASNGFSQVRSVDFSRWLSAVSASSATTLTAAELASCWPVLAGALELLQQEVSDETQS